MITFDKLDYERGNQSWQDTMFMLITESLRHLALSTWHPCTRASCKRERKPLSRNPISILLNKHHKQGWLLETKERAQGTLVRGRSTRRRVRQRPLCSSQRFHLKRNFLHSRKSRPQKKILCIRKTNEILIFWKERDISRRSTLMKNIVFLELNCENDTLNFSKSYKHSVNPI